MTITEFTELYHPPMRPTCNSSGRTIASFLEENDASVPIGWAEFGRAYGSGFFEGESAIVVVYNPFEAMHLESFWGVMQTYRENGESLWEGFPFHFFPQSLGLLLFAHCNVISEFFLLLDEGRATGKIVSLSGREAESVMFDEDFFGFLHSCFSGRYAAELGIESGFHFVAKPGFPEWG